jgi:hypothetical protein
LRVPTHLYGRYNAGCKVVNSLYAVRLSPCGINPSSAANVIVIANKKGK